MRSLTALLGAFMAIHQLAAAADLATSAADPVQREYEKLLAEDDAAQEEADRWIKEVKDLRAKGAPYSDEVLAARIEQRLAPVKKAYDDFLVRHPNHVPARLAYGSFLYETEDEDLGVIQWERARQLEPSNPAPWNNLANHYGHRGPVSKAFEFYTKAIELNPNESIYLQNLATTTYLFRKDAMEFYKISEKEVFDRALELYRKAMKLDPDNFPLATDYAQSFYGIKPLRTDEALAAWTNALHLASDDFERQGVFVHLARVEINSAMFDAARHHLDLVTNPFYASLRDRLKRNLSEKEHPSAKVPTAASAQVKSPPPADEPSAEPRRPGDLFSLPHRSPKWNPAK